MHVTCQGNDHVNSQQTPEKALPNLENSIWTQKCFSLNHHHSARKRYISILSDTYIDTCVSASLLSLLVKIVQDGAERPAYVFTEMVTTQVDITAAKAEPGSADGSRTFVAWRLDGQMLACIIIIVGDGPHDVCEGRENGESAPLP